MYVRVKRERLTIFVQVEASDTVHKIKQHLLDSLVFQTTQPSSKPEERRQTAIGTIVYDGNIYSHVENVDDIGLVLCRYTTDHQTSSGPQKDHQAGSTNLDTRLLEGYKTLVDSKVENDDILCIVLKRKDSGEYEDAMPLLLLDDLTGEQEHNDGSVTH